MKMKYVKNLITISGLNEDIKFSPEKTVRKSPQWNRGVKQN